MSNGPLPAPEYPKPEPPDLTDPAPMSQNPPPPPSAQRPTRVSPQSRDMYARRGHRPATGDARQTIPSEWSIRRMITQDSVVGTRSSGRGVARTSTPPRRRWCLGPCRGPRLFCAGGAGGAGYVLRIAL
jgi:hypothetical protein